MRSAEVADMSKFGLNRHRRLVWGIVALLMVAALVAPTVRGVMAQTPSQVRDFFGSVVSVEGDVVFVSTTDSIIEVVTTRDTVIRLPVKRDATLDDLLEGDQLAVSLKEDDGGSLVADKLFVIPGKTQHRHVPGTATALSAESITIQPLTRGSDEVTFAITPNTHVNLHRGATQLIEGVFVVIIAARSKESGVLSSDALEINVTPDRPRSRPATPVAQPKREPQNTAKIRGVFEEITADGSWIVSSTVIEVNAETAIESGVAIGQIVEVKGELRDDGSILALEIEAREEKSPNFTKTRFEGVFEGVESGKWIVSGTPVIIVDGTNTDGLPFEGQRVRVKAIVKEDGSIVAREVDNLEPGEGDTDEIKLEGVFLGVDDDGNWIVNGLAVSVNELTKLEGAPVEGNHIEVKAVLLKNGTILALKIEVESRSDETSNLRKEFEIKGVIERLIEENGTISFVVVNGHRIAISELTEIEGRLAAGILVEVKALLQPNGVLIASSIEVKARAASEGDRPATVEIRGVIRSVEHIDSDRTVLRVNRLRIMLVGRTVVSGEPVVGAPIKIEGIFQRDGSILAHTARIGLPKDDNGSTESKIRGFIEEIVYDDAGRIVAVVVNGRRFEVTTLTKIETAVGKGVFVEIKRVLTTQGFVTKEIEVEEPDDDEVTDEVEDDEDSGRPEKVEIEGTVERILKGEGGNLVIVVDGTRVKIVPGRTRIKDGRLGVGVLVEVKGILEDGVLVAEEIKIQEPDDDDNSGRRGRSY